MMKIFSRSKKNENENENKKNEICGIGFSRSELASMAAACGTVAKMLADDGDKENIAEAANLFAIANKLAKVLLV